MLTPRPHYLRFARSLALAASSAALGACAVTVRPADGSPPARPDAVADTPPRVDTPPDVPADVPRDTSVDAPPDALADGRCIDMFSGMAPVTCAAGHTCTLVFTAPPEPRIACVAGPAGGSPCGTIFCASGCRCSDAAQSTCACANVMVGPLPPPELAQV